MVGGEEVEREREPENPFEVFSLVGRRAFLLHVVEKERLGVRVMVFAKRYSMVI